MASKLPVSMFGLRRWAPGAGRLGDAWAFGEGVLGKSRNADKKKSERSESPGGCETESDVGQTSQTGPGRMPIRGQVRVKIYK